MKKLLFAFVASLVFAAPPPACAADTLRVLSTIPELADMTQRIGGDRVAVESLARGTEDIHQVVMRPSFVPKLNRADAVVYLGLTVEHSFLPGLLDAAVNPRMRTDPIRECVGEGCIDVSENVPILEKPTTLSRAEGELHPYGNPHYNVGPQNGPQIAKNIAAGLSRIDPGHAGEYAKNLKAFLGEIEPKISEWKKRCAQVKGMKAVSYHKDVAYLGAFTGLDFIDTIELKPGVPPTPTHLEQLVAEMRRDNVKLIIREQHFSPKIPEWLAKETGAKIAVIGIMAHSLPGTDTWTDLQETNLRDILTATKGGS